MRNDLDVLQRNPALSLPERHLGLASEAGMPAVADPGASVVRAAHDLGLEVVPLVGPSSLLLALAASGLNGQNFAFVGYLPQEAGARLQRIRELEALALRTGQAQLFIDRCMPKLRDLKAGRRPASEAKKPLLPERVVPVYGTRQEFGACWPHLLPRIVAEEEVLGETVLFVDATTRN